MNEYINTFLALNVGHKVLGVGCLETGGLMIVAWVVGISALVIIFVHFMPACACRTQTGQNFFHSATKAPRHEERIINISFVS